MYDYRRIEDLLQADELELASLIGGTALLQKLETGGLGEEAAKRAAEDVEACAQYLIKRHGTTRPACAAFVPGRIEVLGKHTDYAGGGSLVCAMQRGIALVMLPRDDKRLTVRDIRSEEDLAVEISAGQAPRPGHWSDYAISVCRRMTRDFPSARGGADVAFSSSLPPAAGMSSSSALTVALGLVVGVANDLLHTSGFAGAITRPEDLAEYLGAVENGLPFRDLPGDAGVGTFGGSEDHTAILCSQSRLLKWYSYSPVRFHSAVATPERHRFAVGFCGLHARKTGEACSSYNLLADLADAVAAVWRTAMDRSEPNLGAISGIPGYTRTELALAIKNAGHECYTRQQLTERLDHFHHENNLILPAAVDSLESGDLQRFGDLVDRSQRLAETLLHNQTAETRFLAREARKRGATAASAFGAGFGGSVWALVHAEGADVFLDEWSASFRQEFPTLARDARFFLDDAGPAAFWLAGVPVQV